MHPLPPRLRGVSFEVWDDIPRYRRATLPGSAWADVLRSDLMALHGVTDVTIDQANRSCVVHVQVQAADVPNLEVVEALILRVVLMKPPRFPLAIPGESPPNPDTGL